MGQQKKNKENSKKEERRKNETKKKESKKNISSCWVDGLVKIKAGKRDCYAQSKSSEWLTSGWVDAKSLLWIVSQTNH